MFQGASYNGLIGGWDVSKVEDFGHMFEGNPSFNARYFFVGRDVRDFDGAHVSRGDGCSCKTAFVAGASPPAPA